MRRPVLLYIDDSPDDIFLVQSACTIAGVGFELASVRGGAAGWRYLRGEEVYADRELHPFPRMLLLDLKMSDLDGLGLVEAVRQDEAMRDLPVMLFTASDDPADVRRAMAAGVDFYLPKPSTLDELIELMRAVDAGVAGQTGAFEHLRQLSRLPNGRL